MKRMWSKIAVGLAVLAIFVGTQPLPAVPNYTGAIHGVVRDSRGTPFAGAYVKLENAYKRLTFLVVSQEQGQYTADHLPPGQYFVQGIGGGFQSEKSPPITVAEGKVASVDLPLTAAQAPFVPRRVGGGGQGTQELPDGAGKQIVSSKCSVCHNTNTVASRRYNRGEWETVLGEMIAYIGGADNAQPLTDAEQKTILDYLATNFGDAESEMGGGGPRPGNDPNYHFPRTPPTGLAAKYVAVQFDIPTPKSEPHEISVDSDGNGWITQRAAYGKLGRLDVHTLEYTEVDPPDGEVPSRLNGIWNGPQNKLWVVDVSANRRLLAYDTRAREWSGYKMPKIKNGAAAGNTIRVHQNGTVWYNAISNNQVMRLDPKTGDYSVWDVPMGLKMEGGAWPYGMTIGGVDNSGDVFLALNRGNAIARVNPMTGEMKELPVPIENSTPKKGETDSKGNPWFALQDGNALVKVDINTNKMTLYHPPTQNTGIYAATIAHSNDLVWYCTQWTHQIGRFDPKTETWLELYVPNADSDIRRCQVDQTNPNRVWWSGNNSNWMGYVELMP